MKWTRLLLPILVLSGLCFCMGCIQTPESSTQNVTEPTVTLPIPSTAIPIPTVTPMPVRAITITPTVIEEPDWVPEEEPVPDWTEAPIVYPPANPDINGQNFTKFSNDDFFCQYPGTWSVINETFTLKDITVYGKDVWRYEGRKVSFVSEDGNVSMTVTVLDFITPGIIIPFSPTIDKARNTVQAQYPNASADTSVYGYQYAKNEQGIATSKYDVIFALSSEYYPYSFTEEIWTTYHHKFTVDFITKNGDLYQYNDLKYLMMKSVKTEGLQDRKWW